MTSGRPALPSSPRTHGLDPWPRLRTATPGNHPDSTSGARPNPARAAEPTRNRRSRPRKDRYIPLNGSMLNPGGQHGHQKRGVETPAFRPGRKRRFTSPEMSVLSDSVFACPGTDCFPPPPRKRCCGTTAGTPGMCGTWPSSSTPTGTPAGTARRATWSSAAAHPGAGGIPVAGRRLPNGAAAGAARLQPGDDGLLRPGQPGRGGRRGARPAGTRDSG